MVHTIDRHIFYYDLNNNGPKCLPCGFRIHFIETISHRLFDGTSYGGLKG